MREDDEERGHLAEKPNVVPTARGRQRVARVAATFAPDHHLLYTFSLSQAVGGGQLLLRFRQPAEETYFHIQTHSSTMLNVAMPLRVRLLNIAPTEAAGIFGYVDRDSRMTDEARSVNLLLQAAWEGDSVCGMYFAEQEGMID